jgi:hypothetical protein
MANTYLSKASYGTPTNNKIFTFSCWVKKAKIGSGRIFDFYSAPFSYGNGLFFTGSDQLGLGSGDTGNGRIITNRVFRDTSAWYHIVAVQDTTNATASDRLKLYVNGERETSFSASVDAVLNAEYQAFRSDVGGIGTYYDKSTSSEFFDGSMSHIHFIDGTAYDASAFGETDATTGIWKPKTAPSVTYGTNGFFLKFENSGAFGTDSSGNANNFTVNGTMTQTIDTPSNVFATGNPLHKGNELGAATFSNGNNTHNGTTSGVSYPYTFSTLAASSGKWYAEFKRIAGDTMIGIGSGISDSFLGGTASAYGYSMYQSGEVFTSGSGNAYGNALSNNDIIGVAMDLDNSKCYWSKNGVWQNSGDPESGATGTGAFSIQSTTSNTTGVYHFAYGKAGNDVTDIEANFGNGFFGTTAVSSAQNPDDGIGIFEYAVPTGYKSLCTKSINAQEYD